MLEAGGSVHEVGAEVGADLGRRATHRAQIRPPPGNAMEPSFFRPGNELAAQRRVGGSRNALLAAITYRVFSNVNRRLPEWRFALSLYHYSFVVEILQIFH